MNWINSPNNEQQYYDGKKSQRILTWRKIPLNLDRALLYRICSLGIHYVTEGVSHVLVVTQLPQLPSAHGTHLTRQLWNRHYLELVSLEDHSREDRCLLCLIQETQSQSLPWMSRPNCYPPDPGRLLTLPRPGHSCLFRQVSQGNLGCNHGGAADVAGSSHDISPPLLHSTNMEMLMWKTG